MAEQTGSKDTKESSLISDTISELLQNSAPVDIAKTLGLLDDDPASLMVTALDTSSMLDPTSFLNPPSSVAGGQTSSVVKEDNRATPHNPSVSKSLEGSSSTLLKGQSPSSTQAVSTTAEPSTSTLGFTPSPIPIPTATHIPRVDSASNDQRTGRKVEPVGVASQTLSELCSSLLVGVHSPTSSSLTTSVPTTISTTVVKTKNLPSVATAIGHVTSNQLGRSGDGTTTTKAVTAPPLPQTVSKPSITIPSTSSGASPLTSSGAPEAKKLMGDLSTLKLAVGTSSLLSPATTPVLSKVQQVSTAASQPLVLPLPTTAAKSQVNVAAKTTTVPMASLSSSSSSSSLSPAPLQVSTTGPAAVPAAPQHLTNPLQASLQAALALQKAVSSTLTRPQTSTNISSLSVQIPSFPSTSATPKAAVSMTTAATSAIPSQVPKNTTTAAASVVTPPTVTPIATPTKPPAVGVDNTAPKGLNLPILQFLQANFPALQLGDTSKDVFQVHTLLAHVLQQQQQLQQLQQQAQQQVQKAVASGQTSPASSSPSSSSPSSSLTAKKIHLLGQVTRSPVATPSPVAKPSTPPPSKASTPPKPVKPVSSSGGAKTASSPSTSSSASTQTKRQRSPMPVFAQVLPQASSGSTTKITISQGVVGRPSPVVVPKQPKNVTGSFMSPLLLSRQKTKVSSKLVSVPSRSRSPLPPVTASSMQTSTTPLSTTKKEGGAVKMSSRTAAKQLHLAKTLVEPVDAEPMDVDVGEPFQILELPPHLRDHSYSRYNPEEGERIIKQRSQNIRVFSGIPPARVSYAPPLPDSPDTLYKLLKILPKKTSSRRSSSASNRTPSKRNKSGRFTPSGGGRSRRAAAATPASSSGRGSTNRGGRDGSKPSSRGGSEERSASSGSESSDNESELSKVDRRRSQRVAGQRKRYVDDLNISFSDEEMQEGIMNPESRPKKEYKGYGDGEDSEYDQTHEGTPGGGATNGNKPAKSKVTLNPTEGFHHTDVFFEPPPEEANVVERILSIRTRASVTDEERKKYGSTMEEFYVKYKNYSYLHAEWRTYDKLLAGDKRFDGKAKRFKLKQATMMINVDDELFNPEYTMADRVLDVATQTEPNGDIATHYLVKWRSLPYEEATWELEEDTDPEVVRNFNKLQMVPPDDELQFKPRPNPSLFKALKECKEYGDGNRLRPYQLEGVNWLLFNWYTRQNCILADEMGLGKTVQSIVLFNEIYKAGIYGPFLVIAPLSTIANWQREFESWSNFNVVIYHGSVYSRRLINEYELYYRDSSGRIVPDAFKFNVIVTTYEVMLADESELQSIQWRVVIIDEAHRLKNRNCKLLEGLKSLDLEHRVLLTGTPLQNSVEELFSLLNFLEPSTFPSHLAFLQQFGDLKSEEQVDELKAILKPMMLRRLKEDVEKSLAPKEETIVEVELTVIQKQYYRAILERNFTFLSKGGSSAVPSLLNVMMELRKCCNHPFLIKGAEQQIVEDFLRRHHELTLTNNVLVQASGKLVLIDKLLPKLKANGHKVLIFSQMVRVLDILEDYLRMKYYLYERIDGNVRGILRQEAIDRFSKPNSDRFVFLLCTRAGGLGINLTAADTVIIYDSDWNPQNDLQAQARCHRIGQNKAVKVYRLITRNTYEREMFNRASLKLGLDKAVLQSMHGQQSSTTNGAPQMSKKEIEDLLRKGAYGAVMEEDDDANKFCEEDIDQILERRTHVIQLDSEAKGSSFAKASFVSEGSSDINVDDPDFWQKWAEKAKLDLDELANKDSLVLDTPRQRRKVARYGNDNFEEIVDMSDAIDEVTDILPSKGKRGWTKLECLKVEKGLLIYGWGDWRNIVRNGKFKKRQLGVKDIENIARTMMVYCLVHFTGDDKVTPYVNRLINPAIVTEERSEDDKTLSSFYEDFDEQDYLTLKMKDPETLFQDSTYMKHLRRHANKILLRVRQLHILRWSMLSQHFSKIMKGAPAKSLGLNLPKPDEPPPAPWWNVECDNSLLVGIIKHGYEQFGKMRSDPALCFKALCGEEPPSLRKKKGAKEGKSGVGGKMGGAAAKGEDSDVSDSGEEEESEGEGESGPSTPATPSGKRATRSAVNLKPGQYPWPSLAEVNTRARRYISAWLKQQRKEELKQAHLLKEKERREREAEVSRKKEQKKAELAQKWSKREEQDFIRVISFFGVRFQPKANKYNWNKFRQLASLTKKSDERLTLYLHDFKQMCWRVLKKKRIKKGLSGIRVEPVNEERAARCLQRISLLSAVREEILPHTNFNRLIQLCELSFEVPQWWLPGQHDRDLLRGVAKHGLYRSDQLIYNDPDLCFKETVPQTALFDPTTNQALRLDDQDSDSEEEEEEEEEGIDGGVGGQREAEGSKTKSPGSSSTNPPNPVPLGWPKEKAIIIRMTRIVYAFRNKVWPRPMEGLDLFSPVIRQDGYSSESSESEGEGNSDSDYRGTPLPTGETWRKRSSRGQRATVKPDEEDPLNVEVDVEEDRDFEIEKSQGLKLTLKKATKAKKVAVDNERPEKLEVRIPLIQLSFPSVAGMKRIPKKRPAPSDTGESPDTKRVKTSSSASASSSKNVVIIDPTKVSFTDLNGQERVGVINRNTQERLPLKQSPMLKNLRLWLEGHPHYNVERRWGDLVIEWGALKPEMYHRILQSGPT